MKKHLGVYQSGMPFPDGRRLHTAPSGIRTKWSSEHATLFRIFWIYKKKSEFDISDTEDDFNLDAFLNSNLTDLVKKTVEPVMADFIAKGTPEAVSSIHSKNVITFYYF